MSKADGVNNSGNQPLKFDPSQVPGARPDKLKPNQNASGKAGGAGTAGAKGQAGAVHAMHAANKDLKLLPDGDAAPALAQVMTKVAKTGLGFDAKLELLDSRLGDSTTKYSFLTEMAAKKIKLKGLTLEDLDRHVTEYFEGNRAA